MMQNFDCGAHCNVISCFHIAHMSRMLGERQRLLERKQPGWQDFMYRHVKALHPAPLSS